MTLKIIDRSEKEFIEKIQKVRMRLMQEEARRYGGFKGEGDRLHWEQDFLHKIRAIKANIPDSSRALDKVKSVEATIREKDDKSILSFGNLNPGVVLDLL